MLYLYWFIIATFMLFLLKGWEWNSIKYAFIRHWILIWKRFCLLCYNFSWICTWWNFPLLWFARNNRRSSIKFSSSLYLTFWRESIFLSLIVNNTKSGWLKKMTDSGKRKLNKQIEKTTVRIIKSEESFQSIVFKIIFKIAG